MFIELNKTRLFYLKAGHGGAPIILVHGNGESHKIFLKTIMDLSQTYTVYALDMRGQGQSDQIAELHYADMADDVIAFVKQLEIEQPYYFGFSDGGIVGLLASIRQPNLFKKMLIAGANTSPETVKWNWNVLFKVLYFMGRNKIIKVAVFEPHITSEQLKTIATPTVVMMGQHDMIKHADGVFIADNLQHGTLVTLKDENHGSYVFNNEKLTTLIKQHLLDK